MHPVLKRRIIALDALIPALSIQVTQGLRTYGEQEQLYAEGRTTPGSEVTNAHGGFSAHNFGYAVDLVPEDITPGQPDWNIDHPAWKQLLFSAPKVGLAEGAVFRSFPDNPHFYLEEMPADPTQLMRDILAEEGNLQAVWGLWNAALAGAQI